METDMGPVGRVRISPCRTGHTVSIHPHYGPEIHVNFRVAAKRHSGVRANLTVLKLLAIQIMHLMSIGHKGVEGVRIEQIKSWHDRPHLMSLLLWVDKSIKPNNCYYLTLNY